MELRVVATGLEFPEGPLVLPDGDLLVTEVRGGRLTRVQADGSTSVFAVTGGGPNGAAIGPDGAIYVGELRGFPATPGTSRVWRIRPGARHVRCGSSPACRVVARGFTSIIDIAFGRNGKAYVVELDERSWLALESGMGVGGTVNACRPHRHEWRCSAKARELPIPTAVAVRRNRIFVTLFSLVPGRAQVARLR